MESAYDQVPYPGSPDAESHPRRLAGIAALFGLTPADITCCRVLELGCAAGRGLLPMAEEFPESRFVGVDTAGQRVQEASQLAADLGLRNVEFRHASISEIDESWGQFDYVLCLGVLTWVDDEIRCRIFETLRRNLGANGVAVVGYNVFPGWHHRRATSEAMKCFSRSAAEPQAQIQQARAVLNFLADTVPVDRPHGQFLRQDRDYLARSFDDYLYHDFLTDDNRPIYFHEFCQYLSASELQYLGETNFARNSFQASTPESQSLLAKMSFVERCQMLDFLRNESYRKSLICRGGSPLDVAGAAQRMKTLSIALREIPAPSDFDFTSPEPISFQYSLGNFQTAAPFGKAALAHLVEIYPRAVTIPDLHEAARERLGTTAAGARWVDSCDQDQLAAAMFASLYAGLIHVSSQAPEFLSDLPELPYVSPLVRRLATDALDAGTPRGLDTVNRCHEIVSINRITSFVLSHLDGTRNQADLVRLLDQAVNDGQLALDPAKGTAAAQLDAACREICEFRFLTGEP